MKSSPRNFRLSDEALKALKVLESLSTSPGKRGDIVSNSIIAAANNTLATPPIQYRLLDPAEFLSIQATLSEIESLHRQNRKNILKIRPADRNQAGELTQAAERIDAETNVLTALRIKLSDLARTTSTISAEDSTRLQTLINWALKRVNNPNLPPEDKPIYELEARILKSLIP